ncbi:50S ribosomal protein L32 [Candidatus Uhrbacteria bacterium]|nr:50S ribosomal protein L32 [Candidatus Uhrbacteria bacterium]
MPLPGHRHSKSKTRRRRAHHALKPMQISDCPKCKAPVRPHTACAQCGFYRGRQVLNVARSVERLMKRAQEKMKAKTGTHDHDHEEHKEEKEHASG